MAPGTHFLLSWTISTTLLKYRRERTLVTVSGVVADVDGLGLAVDLLTGTSNWYGQLHHVVTHNLATSIVLASICAWLASVQKHVVWALSFICFHLHILCDVMGSKGPDGFQWPIYYLYPLSSEFTLVWAQQWLLNGWQNQLFTATLLLASLYIAVDKNITCLEVLSVRMDAEVFNMYTKYVGKNNVR
ncbi:metal-dependent hydrolase [Pseudoalteromonas obscura]|uniref:Metal-dependent hydrolase n=1 Tax=Pseudoalteromonas obscura TaxID=3048491 RepID=A0ABT7ENX6_9GAMM|nr:metal-dependent hydrolase [Pseudoalteromonas sp. P94(2023)]MDK2596759.1 metal-dependent hydrolase [Pseudoalteromonas sp. P94(2023)]